MCTYKLYQKVRDVNYLGLLRLSFFVAFYLLLALFFFMFFIFLLEETFIYFFLSVVVLFINIYISVLVSFNLIINDLKHIQLILLIIQILVPSIFVLIGVFGVTENRFGFTSFSFVVLFPFYILLLLSKRQIGNLEKLKDFYEEIANYMNANNTVTVLNRAVLHDLAILVSVLDGGTLVMNNGDLSLNDMKSIYEAIFLSMEKIREVTQNAYALIDGNNCNCKIEPKMEILKVIELLKSKLQQETITVLFKDESSKVTINGDRVIFGRIFLNIFLNAIEELEKCNKRKKEIKILLKVSEQYLVVEVIDSGNGIKYIDLEGKGIFWGEFSSKRKNRIGSGLMFCKMLIREKFAGHIKIFSEEDKYTKVSLYYRIS